MMGSRVWGMGIGLPLSVEAQPLPGEAQDRTGFLHQQFMGLKTYQDLEVWQLSMDLATEIYCLTRGFPSDEKFGMTSQMRRASTSVPCNIAEGYGRVHRGDYLRHLSIARGSLFELETQLLLTVKLGLATQNEMHRSFEMSQSVGRMLTRLIMSLQPKPQTPNPGPHGAPHAR